MKAALERGFSVETKLDRSLVTDADKGVVEEAGGRYAVVRDFPGPDGARILSAVFGQPAVVDRLVALFQEARAPGR